MNDNSTECPGPKAWDHGPPGLYRCGICNPATEEEIEKIKMELAQERSNNNG